MHTVNHLSCSKVSQAAPGLTGAQPVVPFGRPGSRRCIARPAKFVDFIAGKSAEGPMTIYHRRIQEMVRTYGIASDLDPDEDVRLEMVLDMLEQALRATHVEDRTVYAVKNIVMELAGNTLLHGTGARTEQELLVVNRRGENVQIWLFGYGLNSEVDRLFGIIREIRSYATPPDHREPLLERRNIELMRRASSEPSKLRGAGVGMLTIAALSSKPLWFKLNAAREHSSFALRSTVQAASA
jgi:hypothetical protein